MDNGTSPQVVKQFNHIAQLPDQWGHSRQYYQYFLDRIGYNRKAALDVGCGTGTFTRELAARCERVTGIDVAETMIEEAGNRNALPNIEYTKTDMDSFLENKMEEFDVIVCIATLHHLDIDGFFKAAKKALRPGGVLLVLDLYQARTPLDFFLSATAALCNPVWNLIKRGRISVPTAEREAWKGHEQHDFLDTLFRIRNKAHECLGTVEIRRHLFWRYSLRYKKE